MQTNCGIRILRDDASFYLLMGKHFAIVKRVEIFIIVYLLLYDRLEAKNREFIFTKSLSLKVQFYSKIVTN